MSTSYVKVKRRSYPCFGGFLDVDPSYAEDVAEKVKAYCMNKKRESDKRAKRNYRKQRNSYHPNNEKLLHFRPIYVKDLNENVGSYCIASCEDWYVVREPSRNCECYLWNCISHQKIQLPKLKITAKNYFKCLLTAPPSEKHCEVMFFNRSRPSIICYRLGYKWVQKRYDKHPDNTFSDVVSCNGNIYAIERKGKILYQLHSQPGGILNVSHASNEEVVVVFPEKQHLVESCGEVYLVQRFSSYRLEVYKMDFSSYDWVKVESLGNCAFFLSCNHSVSLNAEELGIEGNCIYFTEDNDSECLYVFNLGDGSLFVCQHGPNLEAFCFSWEGQLPVLRLLENPSNNQPKDAKEKEVVIVVNGENDSVFKSLPFDVLEKIGRCLGFGSDYMNFRLVNRRWRLAAPRYRWVHDSESDIRPLPWLMFFNGRQNDMCKFYDPGEGVVYNKTNTGNISAEDCVVWYSREGWLIVSQGKKNLFLFELFTQKRISLPNLPVQDLRSMCFSGSPRSPDCVVVCITHIEPELSCIGWLPLAENRWHAIHESFIPSWNNSVFMDGKFYFLGQDGILGCLTLLEQEWDWKVFNLHQKMHLPTTISRSFLVSANQHQLLSVFVGNSSNRVGVYEFDFAGMEWVELDSLEGSTLFVSETASLAMGADQTMDTMKDTIYFPRLSKINCSYKIVPYCMKSCRFKTNDNEDCDYIYDTKEHLRSVWFQHRLLPTLELNVTM